MFQTSVINPNLPTNWSTGANWFAGNGVAADASDVQCAAPLHNLDSPDSGTEMIPQFTLNLNHEAHNLSDMINHPSSSSRKRIRIEDLQIAAPTCNQQQAGFLSTMPNPTPTPIPTPSPASILCYQQSQSAGILARPHIKPTIEASQAAYPINLACLRGGKLNPYVDEASIPSCISALTTDWCNNTAGSCQLPCSLMSHDLQSHFMMQKEDIDHIIEIQGDQMTRLLEERRQWQVRAILALMEESLCRRLKEKDDEVIRIARHNAELEERVKQLTLEANVWKNLARNNEAMVPCLRNSLEQLVAQSREQSKVGVECVDSGVDDAQSSNHIGGYDDQDVDAHIISSIHSNKTNRARLCRVCNTNNVCMLLLPCRHLCLCVDCHVQQSHCPICKTLKKASLQVFTD